MSKAGAIAILFDWYLAQARDAGRADLDATLWADRQAQDHAQGLNRDELRLEIRRIQQSAR